MRIRTKYVVAFALPIEERVAFVRDLWDSLDGPIDYADEANVPPEITRLLELPADDRIERAMALWDSGIDDGYHNELTDEQKAELDRRLQNAQEHPEQSILLEEVHDRLLKRNHKS